MYVPRLRTNRTASPNFSEPAQTSAEYSPRLCPATKSASKPFSAKTRAAATETVKIAGCVLAVSFSSSSVPSKHSLEIEKPSALSASSKTDFATAHFSASSLPIPGYCEACPGNTNATLPIADSSMPPSGRNRGGGELLFDSLVDARAGETRGHADGVFHGVGVRTPMANHANTLHTQKRRPSILRVINLFLQPLERPFRKLGPQLGKNGTLQGLLQRIENGNRQAFANLQRDVSDKTIAHDHVHAPGKKVPAFHISHKMNRTFLQQSINFAGQYVTFNLFLSHGKQSHARAPTAKSRPVIYLAHHRELQQMLRPRIHVCSHVKQHGNAAPRIGKRSG